MKFLAAAGLVLLLLAALPLGALAQAPEASSESPPAPVGDKRVRLVIRGVSGELKDNVTRALELRALIRKQDATDAQIARLYARAPKQIAAALQPFGFDQPVITSTLKPAGKAIRIVFEINPGQPTRVRELEVLVRGPAQEDRRVRNALRRFKLKPGSVLLHADYEAGKAEISRSLQSLGYFDAKLVTKQISLNRSESRADIKLNWESGARYRFGATSFTDAHLDASMLERFVAYREGDFYDQNRLLETQQRLTDGDYFSSIEIEVEPGDSGEEADADRALALPAPASAALQAPSIPVTIRLQPAKRSIYRGGLSFGTDSGAGVRAGLERRYVNSLGHKLRIEGEYSQRLELLAANYQLPRSEDYRSSYGLGASYKSEITDSFSSNLIRLSAALTNVWGKWLRTQSINMLDGDFTVGGELAQSGERGQSRMVFPEFELERREADDLQNVRKGWHAKGVLRAASSAVLSDADLLQMVIEGKWIRAIDDRQRVLLRGLLGSTWTNDFTSLPPELRFFAGGDLSVRGYDYQSLGPTNARGGVIGGEHSLVLSAEYEFALNEQFAVAGFLDAGNAYSSNQFDTELGAGLGLRWRSPVGMVRIDLGFPLTGDGGPRPHLVIGPDL